MTLYQLYHTILQYIQHLNFYFLILLIKIIFLHNKIIYPKITIIYNTTHYLFFLSHSFCSRTTTNLLKPPSSATTTTDHHQHQHNNSQVIYSKSTRNHRPPWPQPESNQICKPNLQQKSSKKPMKITHVMREVTCSLERESREGESERGWDWERGG